MEEQYKCGTYIYIISKYKKKQIEIITVTRTQSRNRKLSVPQKPHCPPFYSHDPLTQYRVYWKICTLTEEGKNKKGKERREGEGGGARRGKGGKRSKEEMEVGTRPRKENAAHFPQLSVYDFFSFQHSSCISTMEPGSLKQDPGFFKFFNFLGLF